MPWYSSIIMNEVCPSIIILGMDSLAIWNPKKLVDHNNYGVSMVTRDKFLSN